MTHTHIFAGNSAPTSYVSNVFIGFSTSMTFWGRSFNTLMYMFETTFNYFVADPMQEAVKKKYFPNYPDLDSINKNISLFLINNHESINSPIPSVPNMINILGFHLKEENTLPKNLQDYIDSAHEGVILFSFGSFVNPSQLSPRVKQAFVKALGKLKQKVLWKSDEDSFLGKPNNIKLSKWLPQEDILAHPNCKLFITHAGFLSTIETIYHGVPVLTFPLTGDQDLNAFRAVEIDMGHTAVLRDITEEKLDYFLDQLLHNDK
uniref:UDP-glucuronosyltransferase n=1 Tax=Diabrotica virgifera virgifera TaxID=50390 RepID=A0A6P7GEE6_DIAVI